MSAKTDWILRFKEDQYILEISSNPLDPEQVYVIGYDTDQGYDADGAVLRMTLYPAAIGELLRHLSRQETP